MSTVRGYLRSSRPPKAWRERGGSEGEAPLGIESQRADIRARFPDAQFYEDRFRSGRTARRPGLIEMVDDLQPGDLVVVVRLDRLARDVRISVALEHTIETVKEARIVSLAGEGTSADGRTDPTETFIRRVIAAQAELAAAQVSLATKAAFRARRAERRPTHGRVPYGYSLGEDGRLVEVPDQIAAIEAVRRWVKGDPSRHSPTDVAKYLTKRGFAWKSGQQWTAARAGSLLRRIAREREEAMS